MRSLPVTPPASSAVVFAARKRSPATLPPPVADLPRVADLPPAADLLVAADLLAVVAPAVNLPAVDPSAVADPPVATVDTPVVLAVRPGTEVVPARFVATRVEAVALVAPDASLVAVPVEEAAPVAAEDEVVASPVAGVVAVVVAAAVAGVVAVVVTAAVAVVVDPAVVVAAGDFTVAMELPVPCQV